MKIGNSLKVFSCFAIGCFVIPSLVCAGQLKITSHTNLSMFERNTRTEEDLNVIPLYEYLGVDYISDVEGLSFHGYGWGRLNLGDDGFYPDENDGEVLYGYLEYRHAPSNTSMLLGRHHLFSGVSNVSLDGVSMRAALGTNFNVLLYGGSPVSLSDDGRVGDSVWGGRISNYRSGLYELGLSYKLTRNDDSDDDEKLGVDISLDLPHAIGLSGFSSLNLLSDSWAEHSYEMQIPAGNFLFRPFFRLFQYDDYFFTEDTTPDPFKFLATTGEELTTIGAEVDWFGAPTYEVNLKLKDIEYDLRPDSSQYVSAIVIKHFQDLCQVGFELGNMFGHTPETEYFLGRTFVYWNSLPESFPLEFISADLIYVGYQEDIYGQDNSTFVSLGTGKSFLDKALALKFSLDYSKDPYFDNDFRAMLIAEYTFTHTK